MLKRELFVIVDVNGKKGDPFSYLLPVDDLIPEIAFSEMHRVGTAVLEGRGYPEDLLPEIQRLYSEAMKLFPGIPLV